MKKILKENKAITLIALVITIVVLIILAGVLINLTLGENGIFTRAKIAKQKYEYAAAKETIELKLVEIKTEIIAEGKECSAEEINNILEGDKDVSVLKTFKNDENDAAKVTDIVLVANSNSKYKFLVENTGKINKVTTEEISDIMSEEDFYEIEEFEQNVIETLTANNEKRYADFTLNYETKNQINYEIKTSSNVDTNRTGDKIFDNSLNQDSGCWHSAYGSAHWIEIDFANDVIIDSFKITNRESGYGYYINNFTLQAMNASNQWVDIQEFTHENHDSGGSATYLVDSSTNRRYKKYRWNITSTTDGYAIIGELSVNLKIKTN